MTALPNSNFPSLSDSSGSMPSLPTPGLSAPPPSAPIHNLRGLPGTPERAAHFDQIVAANRAKVPAHTVDARARPRLSIGELNEMDGDELRERFLNTGPEDQRTPVQKIMDIVDLPRNTNANIMFGHPTAAGVIGSYPAAAGGGAVFGGILGGIVGGIGGGIAGLAAGGVGAIPGAWGGAVAGAETGAALGGAGGLAANAVTQAASLVGRAGSTETGREAVTNDKEIGAAGQPRIFTSDALRQMGVNNRVINSIVGFGGDLVMDPLTWAGPSGWGAKIGAMEIGPTARAVLDRSIQEASTGGVKSIADEATRNVLLKAGLSPDLTDKAALSAAIYGDVNKGIGAKAGRVIGEGKRTTGGVLDAQYLAEKTPFNPERHELIDAAKNWYATHGVAPGVGSGSETIAHLPFGGLGPIPEFNINVPGFTPAGKETAEAFRWAAAKEVATPNPYLDAVSTSAKGVAEAADSYARYVDGAPPTPGSAATPGYGERVRSLEDSIAAEPTVSPAKADFQTRLAALKSEHDAVLAGANAELAKREAEIRSTIDAYAKDPTAFGPNRDVNRATVYGLGQMLNQADAIMAKHLTASNLAAEQSGMFKETASAVAARQGNATRLVNELKGMQTVENHVKGFARTEGLPFNVGDTVDMAHGAGESFGPDGMTVEKLSHGPDGRLMAHLDGLPDPVPADMLHPLGRTTRTGDIGLAQEAQARSDALRSRIAALEQKSGATTPVGQTARGTKGLTRAEISELASSRAELDTIQRPYLNRASIGLSGAADAARAPREYILTDHAGKAIINGDQLTQAKAFEAARPLVEQIKADSDRIAGLVKGGKVDPILEESIRTGQQPLFQGGESQAGPERAEYAALSIRLAEHRAQLHAVTEPLRQGPHVGEDQWLDQIKQGVLKAQDADHLDIFNKYDAFEKQRPPGDAQWQNPMETRAEMLKDAIRATQKYRDAIGGVLAPMRSAEEGKYIGIVRRATGLDNDTAAHSWIGGMSDALGGMDEKPVANQRFLDAMDRQLRPLFGVRGGKMGDAVARVRSRTATSYEVGDMIATQQLRAPIRAAIDKLGIADPKVIETVDTLVEMMAHNERNKAFAALGKDPAFALKYEKDGKLIDSPLVERMNGLMNGVRAATKDPKMTEEFFDELRQVARSVNKQLDLTGEELAQANLLKGTRPGYFPKTMGPDAAARVGVASKTPGYRGSGEPNFRNRSEMDYYLFPDTRPDAPADSWESFLHRDRDLLNPTPEMKESMAVLEKTDTASWQAIQDTIEKIGRYDRMPVPPQPTQLDIPTANEFVKDGRTDYLNLKTPRFFEERAPRIIASYYGQVERAKAAGDWMDLVAQSKFSMDANKFTELAAAVGKSGEQASVMLPDGTQAHFYNVASKFGKNRVPIMYANGQSYRALDKEMLKFKDNAVIKGLIPEGFENVVLPEPMADAVEELAHVWRDDGQINAMFGALDKATGVLKTTMLLSPSWFIKSITSHLTLLGQVGVNPVTWGKSFFMALKIVRYQNDPEMMAKLGLMLKGQPVEVQKLVEALRMGRIIGDAGNPFGDIGAQQAQNEMGSILPSRLTKMPAWAGTQADFQYRAARYAASNNPALAKAGYPLAAAATAADTLQRRFIQPFYKVYQVSNDTARVAGVLALVEDGHDINTAIELVRKGAYDYENLTQFERKYARVMVPFYNWARNNIPYQVGQLFVDPKWVNAYPKVKNAMEEMFDGENKVPDSMRPRWMQSEQATQIGTNPSSRFALMLGNFAPQLEAVEPVAGLTGTQGVMDAANFATSQVNPLLTLVPQIGAGKEFFTGRTIGPDESKGDISLGDFLQSQVRPLAEYGPGGKVAQAFQRGGPVAGAARFIGGGNVQAFDQDRLVTSKAREMRDDIEKLRGAITMAERVGNKRASKDARVQLLQVYQHAQQLGLEDHVQIPGWARKELGNMAGATSGR